MHLTEESISQKIFEKSKEVIPGGVNSPIRACQGMPRGPLIAKSGSGEHITDVDGKTFLDCCMSWGALLHGHAHPKIVETVKKRVENGSSFGIATPEEEMLARLITDKIESIEKVRFVSSGTEATMSAVRLARGYTSRELIIKFNGNYHGHADGFLVKSGSGTIEMCEDASSLGVPKNTVKQTLSLPYNDIETFKKVMRDPFYSQFIAGVIVEPVAANMGVVLPTDDFLKTLREETKRIGALLIFDEVITGFRISMSGAESVFGVTPDLVCLGKIIGGGFPAAAFGGRKEIMDLLAPEGSVYQAGTLSGNPVAMVAGCSALELASEGSFYSALEKKTKKITTPIKELIERNEIDASIQETVGMFTLFLGPRKVSSFEDLDKLDKEWFNRYFQFMWDRGVYVSPSPYEACFISSIHSDESLEKTCDLMMEFLRS